MYILQSFKAPMVHLSPGWTEATSRTSENEKA